MVRDLLPGTTRIGLLVNPINVSDLSQRQEIQAAGAAMGATLIPVETRTPEDLDSVFHASSERACGLADRAAGSAVFHATPNNSRGRVGDEIAHALRTARARR